MIRPEAEQWRPDCLQELILRAAVLRGPRATEAWRAWRQQCSVLDADSGSYRLLPQVYRNLLEGGCEDAELALVKGVYRHAWSSNQLLYDRSAKGVAALQAAGMRTMLLKGAAISVAYQRDLALRPMADVDVLVARARASEALDVLARAGWRPERGGARERLRCRHSEGFVHDNGGALDLHWFSLWHPAPEDGLWERARPAAFGELEVLAPGPADQLLITCVHGACWNPVPSQRWVADAFVVLDDNRVDWELLISEARRRRLTLHAHQALGYLRECLDAPVPADVLRRLRRTRRRRHERAGYRASAGPCPPHNVVRAQWDRYRRVTSLVEHRRPGPIDFARYATRAFGVQGPWRLALYGTRSLLSHGLRAPAPAPAAASTSPADL